MPLLRAIRRVSQPETAALQDRSAMATTALTRSRPTAITSRSTKQGLSNKLDLDYYDIDYLDLKGHDVSDDPRL